MIGGLTQWLFAYRDRLSVTISAAGDLIDWPREALAERIWREVAELTGLRSTLPPWRIVKEKRATFAATPAQDARRPPSRTRWSNVFLAGDWVQTGLPATIEGAVRSGCEAASLAVATAAKPKSSPEPRSHDPRSSDFRRKSFSSTRRRAPLRGPRKALHARQREDGHWRFELEADATIPAEYVLLRHFRGEERDAGLERLIAAYLRRIQGDHGGWPLVHGGAFDVSASVKAYFALKTIGDDPQAPHMARARAEILDRGGAAKSNVFTRFLLALFGEIPWSGVPTMPVEIMLLPRWFPFHLDKVSYWARTVLVPLLVLQALKPRAANPGAVRIAELFVAPPETVRKWPTGAHQHWAWVRLFGAIDRALKLGEPLFPARLRAAARSRRRFRS